MDYAERLSVPLRWWVQGTMLVAGLWLTVAVVDALAGWVIALFTLVVAAAVAAALVAFGSTRIEISDGEFRVGRAHIPLHFLGAAEALDAEHTRRISGVDADARAHLVLRPFLKRSVKVTIEDPADPTPYWLVSTRHPQRLAHQLDSASRQTTQR